MRVPRNTTRHIRRTVSSNINTTIVNKTTLKNLLENTKALEDALKFIYRTTDQSDMWPFSNYKTFMRKYNDIAILTHKELEANVIFDIYDIEKVKDWGDTLRPQQKMYFDSVITNVALLRSTLENKLDVKNEEILNLKNFLQSTLRKAIMVEPENEQYVQDTVEQILIGKGFSKGIDYDREVGRIKVSIKEYKPDFIFLKLDLALEIKISKTKTKSKVLVDEINADINAYRKKYNHLLFLIYDLGTIRDEDEFKNDLDNKENVQLVVIKH
ncbi:MAG: hypothetical protein RL427_284 [Bacteroidota bacterium]